jgi:hypothetical protein
MILHRLGGALLLFGLAGLVGAFAWWSEFYSQVARFIGSKGPLPSECLYSTTGPCRLVAGVANWAGVHAYEPALFWIAIVSVLLGLLIRATPSYTVGNSAEDEYSKVVRRVEPRM